MKGEPQWWVAAVGDTLIWARLTITSAGIAEVFDSDGGTLGHVIIDSLPGTGTLTAPARGGTGDRP